MKLRGRIMTLLITPIVLFGVIIFLVCATKITSMTNDIIKNDLHASALAGRSMLKNSGGMMDAFKLDDNGDMYNGDKNITMNTGNADAIKKASGIDTVVFYGDTRKMSTIKRADGSREENSQASAAVISAVLEKGEEYFTQHDNISGSDYYSYYVPLFNSLNPDKPIGMIAAGKSRAQVQKELLAILTWIFAATVVLVAAAIAVGLFFIKRICRRIAYGVSVVEQVSGGQLNVELDQKYLHSKDEIGDILRAIDKLKTGLYDIVKDILELSMRVQSASDGLMERANQSSIHISQVDTAVTEIAQGATSQAEETQNTTDNVVRMGDMLEKNNSEVDVLNENAKQMIETGDQAISTLSALEAINDKTRQAVEVISEQTNTTNESAQKIREAINLITDIAEETNLLSLNASIEAARAGEQGRGFAVVAGQIQKLAEQSNESAHKIETIVASLIEDSHKAVDAMEEVKTIIDEQSSMVSKTSDMFGELKSGIDTSVSSVNVIAESTKVIEEARTNVVDAVQNLTSIAEENAASTEETAAAVTEISEIVRQIAVDSDSLEKISRELEAKIEFFRLDDDAVPNDDAVLNEVLEENPDEEALAETEE